MKLKVFPLLFGQVAFNKSSSSKKLTLRALTSMDVTKNKAVIRINVLDIILYIIHAPFGKPGNYPAVASRFFIVGNNVSPLREEVQIYFLIAKV